MIPVLGPTVLGYLDLKSGEDSGLGRCRASQISKWGTLLFRPQKSNYSLLFLCKKPWIINTLISYQADKLGWGMNKPLSIKGRPG